MTTKTAVRWITAMTTKAKTCWLTHDGPALHEHSSFEQGPTIAAALLTSPALYPPTPCPGRPMGVAAQTLCAPAPLLPPGKSRAA
jgi:hypothetical protein